MARAEPPRSPSSATAGSPTPLAATAAGACFVTERTATLLPPACVALVTPMPQSGLGAAAGRLHRPSASIRPIRRRPSRRAELEDDVSIGHGAVIGAGAQIGARDARSAPHAVIGPGVAIGRDCRIGAGAVDRLRPDRRSGDDLRRRRDRRGRLRRRRRAARADRRSAARPGDHAGRRHHRRRQTCIDRGAFDDTVIGENTKIDNLVQIAHNVAIGRNCVIAGHVGLSGSAVIGDGVQLGGRVRAWPTTSPSAPAPSSPPPSGVMQRHPRGRDLGRRPGGAGAAVLARGGLAQQKSAAPEGQGRGGMTKPRRGRDRLRPRSTSRRSCGGSRIGRRSCWSTAPRTTVRTARWSASSA